MSTGLMSDIYMFVLAILVGYEVITKVPSTFSPASRTRSRAYSPRKARTVACVSSPTSSGNSER